MLLTVLREREPARHTTTFLLLIAMSAVSLAIAASTLVAAPRVAGPGPGPAAVIGTAR